MDLLKAFETLGYSLLLAKLNAYKFDSNTVSLVQIYLTKRFQRNNITSAK